MRGKQLCLAPHPRSWRHIMLAHSGLALITEKLQNQRLEESSTTACCSQLQLTQENLVKTTCQQQSSLTVKGKNVWAISLESQGQGWREYGNQNGATTRPPEKEQVCRHEKPRNFCQLCGGAPGTPMAPPKKKHCTSLSVLTDSPTVFPAPARDPGGNIWKPLAVIPKSNNDVQDSKEKKLLPTVHTSESTSWLSTFSSGFKLLPVVTSPPSVDRGHCTTSTPPGSPIPRPSSAASDTSFSSQGSAWYDYSPMRSRVRVLENRSLSCEDRISGSSSTSSMTCIYGSLEPSTRCCNSSHDGINICSGSSIPRCHSQPCVLHHRRCGKKRRRNCDRPTLNFIKMTETAYTHSHQRSEPWDTPGSDQRVNVPLHQMFPESLGFGLNPIASSPLDSELPAIARHLMNLDLTSAASTALPPTPPYHVSPSFPQQISSRNQEEEEEEDEEEEGNDCDCQDSRVDDGVGFFSVNDLDIEEIESH